MRELLAHLVLVPGASRETIADDLWPHLEGEAAANNLRGTLSHLLGALEPHRGRAPSYFVRQGARDLTLTGVDRLEVDVWSFERHLDDAEAAERAGTPSAAVDARQRLSSSSKSSSTSTCPSSDPPEPSSTSSAPVSDASSSPPSSPPQPAAASATTASTATTHRHLVIVRLLLSGSVVPVQTTRSPSGYGPGRRPPDDVAPSTAHGGEGVGKVTRRTAWAVAAALAIEVSLGGGTAARATDETTAVPATTEVPATTLPPTVEPPPPPDLVPPVVTLVRGSAFVSPNGDGRLDQLVLRITVDEPVRLRVEVVNPASAARAVPFNRAVDAGTTRVTWRGRLQRSDGTRVDAADRRHDLVVTATDVAGNTATARSSVIVDTRAPRLRAGSVGPEPWTGGGLFTQRLSTSDSAQPLTMWTRVWRGLRLVDESLRRIRPASTHAIRWHPRSGGRRLPVGGYHAQVLVRDAAGNTAASDLRPFRVHRSGPTQVVYLLPPSAGRRVALTIDDCADPTAWASMLATIDRLDAGATFFCNGDNVRRWPALARRTVSTPRVSIGAHSRGHDELPGVGYGGVVERLLSDQAAWWQTARATPAPWFRPPYGAHDATVRAAAGWASFPYTVLWDFDPRDWDTSSPSAVVSRVLAGVKPRSIILLHTKPASAAALSTIIHGLRARGLQPVGLGEVLAG